MQWACRTGSNLEKSKCVTKPFGGEGRLGVLRSERALTTEDGQLLDCSSESNSSFLAAHRTSCCILRTPSLFLIR